MTSKVKSILIIVGILCSISAIYFVIINSNFQKNHNEILYDLQNLKNLDNKLDKDILLIRTGTIRHYDYLDNGFIEIEKSLNKLNVLFVNDSIKSTNIKKLQSRLSEKIKSKEAMVNTLKSNIGVLHNSFMYYSNESHRLSTHFHMLDSEQLSNELKWIISTELPLFNTLIINLLSNPTSSDKTSFSRRIQFFNSKINNVKEEIFNKKLRILILHLEVIFERNYLVDAALNEISNNSLIEVIDKIQLDYLNLFEENQKKISSYQNLIYILSLILVFYCLKLLWKQLSTLREMKEIAVHLGYQKQALDEHAIVSITDENGIISEVNKHFCETFGIKRKDIIGQNHHLIKSNYHTNGFYKDIWETITTGKVWRGEIKDKNNDGELVWLDQTIVPFLDAKDVIYQYVSIGTDITSRKKIEQDIEFQAYHDALTELPNRRLLMDRLEQMSSLCQLHNHFGGLLFIDLDRFKTINDSLGHKIGDKLLIHVSERLSSCIGIEGTVARLGGDEFVVLLPEVNDDINSVTLELQNKADEIIRKIREPYLIEDHVLYTSASIGITLFPDTTQSSDCLKNADIALYKAKDAGRDCFKFFDASMQEAAEVRLLLENDLRDALLKNEFKMFFQPQYDCENTLIGAELLLRWEHHEKGLISPQMFIPIAEETGIIIKIGTWVMEHGFKKIKYWNDHYPEPSTLKRIAINVSPMQFMQTDFINVVIRLLKETEVDPLRVELEITEGMLFVNIDETIEKIKQLQSLGLSFSIDDFGTGYSSLSYLNRMPIEKLKIDQSFVRDLHLNNNNETIVQTIIFMAKNLGMNVIAEGVETKEELDALNAMGCNNYQGYYFNRPMSEDDFEKLLNID